MEFEHDNMYCGALRRGDVVLYFEENKRREFPAVVLQDDMLNQGLPSIICATIEPYIIGDDVFINEVLLKKEQTGLGKDGICLLYKLCTIDRSHVIAKKAELPYEVIKTLYDAVDVTLGRFRDNF